MSKIRYFASIIVPAICIFGLTSWLYINIRKKKVIKKTISRRDSVSETTKSLLSQLEHSILRDGGKFLTSFHEHLPKGQLYKAANSLMKSNVVTLITGFPIGTTSTTSTDGPLGTLSVARALLAIGKRVVIITDDCHADVIRACISVSELDQSIDFFSFPPVSSFTVEHNEKLHLIAKMSDIVLAIQRPGPGSDGICRTMHGECISDKVAPLRMILAMGADGKNTFDGQRESSVKILPSIAIGKNGNELGMGNIYDLLVNSTIPNAKEVSCAARTDHLILSPVANWGGYALSAAIAVLASPKLSDEKSANSMRGQVFFRSRKFAISSCCSNPQLEAAMLQAMLSAGAKDGVTGKQEPTVDGRPLSESISVLNNLLNIAREF